MSNLSDRDIDRLSREAADSYEPDTSSLSWTRLEQKLVGQMPERPPDGFRFGRTSPYIWGPAVALLAGVSFYLIKPNIYSKLFTRPVESINQISTIHAADSGRSAANAIYTDSLSSGQNSTGSIEGSTIQAGHSDGKKISAEPDNAKKNGSAQPSLLSKSESESSGKGKGSKIAPPVALSSGALSSAALSSGSMNSTSDPLAGKASVNRQEANVKVEPGTSDLAAGERTGNSNQLPRVITVGAVSGTVMGNDSLLHKSSEQKIPGVQKSVHINRSLNIGFAFGADYTDAGGLSNNQLSNNIGITLGYYLTDKFSINTGLIYSNKFYWAPGHGQSRPTNQNYNNTTFAWAPDIEYVNGSFNMYELPLTLRYDFAKNVKTRFFINAGASSYFVMKQTNIYFFHNGGGRPVAWLSNNESPSNYWFGVGDLSFGLETDIGKGFSFQAEPFFRIPLQKMGVENLKMYSYGFMLSFRFAPVLSRAKN